MSHHHEVLDELVVSHRRLNEAIPGVLSGYAQLHRAAMADGGVVRKDKELIALAIAISKECDGCVASHARGRPAGGPPRPRWPRPSGWPS